MGKKVNYVLENGRTVTVDEDTLKDLGPHAGHQQTEAEAVEAARHKANEENTSGLAAAVVSGTNTALGGVPGLIGLSERSKAAVEEHPTEATIGNVGALLAPTGILGKAAKEVTAGTLIGGAAKIGAKGTTGARLLEGAIVGAGANVATTTMAGDKLTIEGLASDIGIGAIVNVGIGALFDKVMSKAAVGSGKVGELGEGLNWKASTKKATPLTDAVRAREAVTEATELASERVGGAVAKQQAVKAKQDLDAAKKVFDESPAYGRFRDAYTTGQKATAEANAAVAKETEDYIKATSPKEVNKTVSGLEKAQAKLRTKIASPKENISLKDFSNRNADMKVIEQLKQSALKAAKAGNTELALAESANAARRIQKWLPEYEGVTIPVKPQTEPAPLGPKLPDTVTDFGKLQAKTIADIANNVDDISKAHLDELAEELGYVPGATPGDTLSKMRDDLRTVFHAPPPGVKAVDVDGEIAAGESAVSKAKWRANEVGTDAARAEGSPQEWSLKDGLKGAKEADTHTGSLFGGAQGWARSGFVAAAGRMADIGGWKGAILRRMAYGAAGKTVEGVDNAMFGAAAGSARAGVIGRIRNTVSEAAANVAGKAQAIRPITAYLAASGKDKASDIYGGDSAKALMDEVHTTLQHAPDATYEMVKGVMGQGGDVAYQLYAQVMNGLQYLSDTAPKDPGINVTAAGSRWTPNPMQTNEWLHRYEAVLDPHKYLERVFEGDGHKAGVEALAYNWPALLAEAQGEASMQAWGNLTLEQHRGLSQLFQQPMSAAQHPDVVMIIQGQFLKSQQMAAQQQSSGKSGGGGNPTGRPPAVQSPVAGSDVSKLTQIA